ncbi:hypothetical protein BsWGS_16697 [Bradybaena similaris]
MASVSLSKIVMVTVNVIFLMFGIAALVVGIVFKVAWTDVREAFINVADEVDFDLQSAGDILGYSGIIIGSFIIVVSLLGCIGACCEVKLLLGVYSTIVLLLVVAEVVLVALVATHAIETKDIINKAMNTSLSGHYYENSTNDLSRAYSALFSKLECCGISNYTINFPYDGTKDENKGFFADKNSRTGAGVKEVIPITCCKGFNYKNTLTKESFTADVKKCLQDQTPSSDFAYTEGCLDKVIDKVKDNKGILIGVGVAILVLEIIMVIIGFFLCCRHKDD